MNCIIERCVEEGVARRRKQRRQRISQQMDATMFGNQAREWAVKYGL